MRNIRVYQSGSFQPGVTISLDKSASNHLIKVLRLKDQQSFKLFNGDGFEHAATLEVNGKKAIAHIQSSSKLNNESSLNIQLLQGISKGDHMDLTIQKSVELGIHAITPVICERTVVNLKGDRLEKKMAHWKGISISACEQSGRAYLPEIQQTCRFNKLIKPEANTLRLMLDPLSTTSFNAIKPESNKLQILIGPEGGLSEKEIEHARENGFTGVSLGPRILRTETAAIASITSAQLLWGDFC